MTTQTQTQTQTQTNSFSPFVFYRDNGHFDASIQTDTLVSPEYFKLLSAQLGEKTISSDFVIEFASFGCRFNFQIVHIDWSLDSDEIDLFLNLENQLIIKATLQGYWEQKETPNFKLEQFNLKLEKKLETPISEFLTSTLWIILGLSSNFRVRIPDLNYDFSAGFELSISEIRKLLEEKQIAYRLLVIENALGVQLPFPQGFIDGKDIESIAFCYHVIIDREFEWFSFPTIIPWEANPESLSWLPEINQPTSVTFRPEVLKKSIFGIELVVGVLTAKIENAVIDNYQEVKENLLKLDGSTVNIKLRSLNGKSRFIAINVPTLSFKSWLPELQKLINLESKFDEMLLERYFNMASMTLDGLTDKQKKEITKRPKINKTPRISQ